MHIRACTPGVCPPVQWLTAQRGRVLPHPCYSQRDHATLERAKVGDARRGAASPAALLTLVAATSRVFQPHSTLHRPAPHHGHVGWSLAELVVAVLGCCGGCASYSRQTPPS